MNVRLTVVSAVLHMTLAAASAQQQVQVPERLTLLEARSLLQNNPALLAIRQEADAEHGDVLDAERYPNPTLSFGSDGWVLDSGRGGFLNRVQPFLTFRQEFPTGGKRDKRKRLEMADVEIASAEARNLHRLLKFDLVTSYYRVVLAHRDRQLSGSVLDQFRKIVELNRIRFEAGEISGAELRLSEAAEYTFFDAFVDAEVRLENARSELLSLFGSTNLNHQFQAVDDFDPSFVPPPEGELREITLGHRSDLAVQRGQVRRSDWAIELEEARSRPDIAVFGGYQKELDAGGPVVGLEVPLFLFNRNEGPIHRARAERRREENRLQWRTITALKELQTALQQLEGDRRRIRALEAGYLEKARQARDITEASYRLGEASLMELLDAERTYSETMQHYHRSLYDFEVSRARLEAAAGQEL